MHAIGEEYQGHAILNTVKRDVEFQVSSLLEGISDGVAIPTERQETERSCHTTLICPVRVIR